MVYYKTSQSKMDDGWGYLYFRKPPHGESHGCEILTCGGRKPIKSWDVEVLPGDFATTVLTMVLSFKIGVFVYYIIFQSFQCPIPQYRSTMTDIKTVFCLQCL